MYLRNKYDTSKDKTEYNILYVKARNTSQSVVAWRGLAFENDSLVWLEEKRCICDPEISARSLYFDGGCLTVEQCHQQEDRVIHGNRGYFLSDPIHLYHSQKFRMEAARGKRDQTNKLI